MDKPSLLLTNHHLDFAGGGQYARQLVALLVPHFTLYADHDTAWYGGNESYGAAAVGEVVRAGPDFRPDVHLLISYRGWVAPRGRHNLQLCFYPVHKNIDGWTHAIVPNDFVARAVRSAWGTPTTTVPVHFDSGRFRPGAKARTCISIGNYFQEADGHSKNQHLVIEWFRREAAALGLDKLILHGFPVDPAYFARLRELVAGDPAIELNAGAPGEQVRADLAGATWLIHANGYGRTAEEQTEHFGMIAVEALLSGVVPIVHASGGCPEILGTANYREFSDIATVIARRLHGSPEQLRACGLVYSPQRSAAAAEALAGEIARFLAAAAAPRRKLNLGCGNDYRPDFVNVDIGNCRKDVEHDLEQFPYPFADGQFDEVVAQHVIEHVDRRSLVRFMRELHRICSPGAVLNVSAPYYLSKNAFTDFTHKNFMTEDSFGYFDPSHQLRELGHIYGIDFEFRCQHRLDRDRLHPEVNIHYRLEVIK